MLLVLLHIAAALPGLTRPMCGGRMFRHIEWLLGRHVQRAWFASIFVFLFALTLRTSLVSVIPPGIPVYHDEYSYLLQADIFASGHLAMPTHPMWEHFQTFHVLQHPTYASKFFPGQAAFLAFGQKVLGHPWWGVVLSVAGMCAAMVWCLRGFLSPGWAFFGGMATALQFATTHYWATSYWGGAVAAIGGCLAVGATGRLLRAPTWASGLVFASGAIVLATTRPFEGCILCLVLLIWLAVAAWRQERFAALARLAVSSMLLPLAIGGGWLLYFNHAVTGDALTFPYVAYTQQYDAGCWVEPLGSVPFPPEMPREMRRYHTEWDYPATARGKGFSGLLASLPHRAEVFGSLLYPIFFVPALLAPLAFFISRPTRAPLLATLAVLAASLSYLWCYAHYFAPALGLFAVLWLCVLRWLRTVRLFGRPVGLAFVRLLPCVLVSIAVLNILAFPHFPKNELWIKADLRQQIEKRLETLSGRHLVLVTYGPHSNVHAEWVYNRAAIDQAKVVWARDLGPRKNAALLAYFKDRHRWCATVTAGHITMGPCQTENQTPAAP